MSPKRIQMTRQKPWRHEHPDAVIVARPSKWGNPFKIGAARCSRRGGTYLEERVKDAETAVRFFRDMLSYQKRPYPSQEEIAAELRGRDLACWCPLDQPCHADVLLELANRDA
ncbi:DUF4326 domain-containing protein [Marinovum algicola]|uniref:DUF4326 domain-containing protein n=1 Tax=Marinovum algicola TaxID=42444 RepID=UPI003529E704